MFKYLLLAGIIYIVYRAVDIKKAIQQKQQDELKSTTDRNAEPFTDYEEVEE